MSETTSVTTERCAECGQTLGSMRYLVKSPITGKYAVVHLQCTDLAKAAVQTDYTQRIRSALVLPPPREDMTELRSDAFATAYRIVAEHSGLEPEQASPLIEAITRAIIDASVIDSAAESFHSRMIAAEAEVVRLTALTETMGYATKEQAELCGEEAARANAAEAEVERLRKIAADVMAKHDPGNEMFSGEDGARRTLAFVTDAAIALESIARATGESK